ncbi:unnamed protein product [Urochloa decumbens]|uniref:Uncharacterized protein n=1 Tax=Urochloa decumbens TaxID=240449 RepID=A0ABC9EIQ0_9POAL
MSLQKQQRCCGAADASSSCGVPSSKHRPRAKGVTGSISGGVSQKQQGAKETAAGKEALVDEKMTPQKLCRGGEKAAMFSRGGGVVHKRTPWLRSTTITQTQAGEKNTEGGLVDKKLTPQKLCWGGEKAGTFSRGGAVVQKRTPRLGSTTITQTQAGQKNTEGAFDKKLTPQKLCPGGEKAGTFSRGGGVVHRRAPRLQSTTITQTQAGEKNAENSSTLNRDISQAVSLRTTGSSQCFNAEACHSLVGKDLQEANDEIQKLNELGLGEDISSAEFLKYFHQLPAKPSVDTYTKYKLDDEKLTPIYERHARYRIRYLKLSPKESKSKLITELKQHNAMDLLEEDLSGELLVKMRYLKHLENDDTLDWFFHPDLCRLQALDDYQRLVPRNHGGCEYADWDKYHKFFYSYETEQEYINYREELSRKLKWMEEYVLIDGTSLRWGKIRTRGAYQAIKIATGFTKITGELAYTGYFECVDNLRFNAFWLNDLDGIYFEIWRQVTKQKKSFRDALEEVYKLGMFPLRQKRMKYALDVDCSDMEIEFRTCTASVTSEVTEDRARELIAEALKMDRPKPYEHYIRKKIAIAQAIGLIPTVKQES